LALAGRQGIELIDVITGKTLRTMGDAARPQPGLAFTPDGQTLLSADTVVRYWEVQTGKEIRLPPPLIHEIKGKRERDYDPDRAPPILYVSPSGSFFAIGSSRSLQLWDFAQARPIGSPKPGGPFAFSSDGRWLATAQKSTVQLWELATSKMFAELQGQGAAVTSLLFAPDNQSLAIGSADHTTLLMDIRLQRLFAPQGTDKWDDGQRTHAWNALAGHDMSAAYRAMARFAADPTETTSFLAKRLAPIASPPPKQIQRWITDLNAESFETRNQATIQLKKLGILAKDAMQKALKVPSNLEGKRRLESLLAELANDEIDLSAGDNLRALRAVQILERLGTFQPARRLLRHLATGAAQAPQTRYAQQALGR
jgi:hypothetical protein